MARRILVAIDSRELGTRLLDVAARLAAGRKAELLGLYVEETEFLHGAGLPFSKILPASGGGWQRLEPHAMERALRARAEELQAELARLAERWQLPWSFRTERGGPGECVIAAASGAELVILGRSSRGGPRRLGRTARRAIMECHVPVLILGPEAGIPPRVTAFFTGDTRVLDAAGELAVVFERPLEVAALSGNAKAADELRQQVRQWLRERNLTAGVHTVNADDPGELTAALRAHPPGLSVVPSHDGVAAGDLDTLLGALEGPVLVLRDQ